MSDLASGRTDLEIGQDAATHPDEQASQIGTDELHLAMRPDHPQASGAVSGHDFADPCFINVSRRGTLDDRFDALLRAEGLRRRVVATFPTVTAALRIVAQSDRVTIVPARLSAPDIEHFGLVSQPLAIRTDPLPVIMRWHRRHDSDLAHRWLRGQVTEILR